MKRKRWSVSLLAGDAQRREDARERDRGGALDVVVERGNALAVFLEQPECVVVREILELDHDAGKHFARCRDELLHELVVGLAR